MLQKGAHFIRSLTTSDFDAVLSVEGASQGHPWSEGLIKEELSALHGLHFGASSGNGRDLYAFLLCRLVADELHIHNLCTLPEQRRRGLATALLTHAFAAAVQKDVRRAFLEVSSSNAAAVRLYSAHSFSTIMTRSKYYSNGDDALVMSRLL